MTQVSKSAQLAGKEQWEWRRVDRTRPRRNGWLRFTVREYNPGPGVDIKTENIAIEVETPDSVADAGGQLRGHRGRVYVAGTNQKAVDFAMERYADSTIGVMTSQGEIVKRSTRKPPSGAQRGRRSRSRG